MKTIQQLNQSDLESDNSNEANAASLPSTPDNELLLGIAGGNEDAFADLYQRYSRPIYHYLCNLIFDDATAEDLLQDVFIAIWNGAKRFRGESKVNTWIYHIAHNKAVSWFRKNRWASPTDDQERTSGEPDLEDRAIVHWRNSQIREALNQLSPSHREVVELAFFHELSYTEIAVVVGCPVGTVKSRMSYARRCLNNVLQQLGIGVFQA